MRHFAFALLGLLLACPPAGAAAQGKATQAHGIAMHGKPKYGPDFTHFEYADPAAPKGGHVRLHEVGTFDSLNPYILKGNPATGMGNVFETLMANAADEAFTEYGLLAETVEMPDDRSWVAFTLRKEARWHDAKPVTVEDVIFSLGVLKAKGRPFFRFYYRDVIRAEKVGPRKVKFTFEASENRELPLIVGQIPILPKHYWAGRDFAKTTLEPLLGSGPYRVTKVAPGRSMTFSRIKDYWGARLAVNRGRHNFDTIRYDYYRDATSALEAFKGCGYDFRAENMSKMWATAYNTPDRRAGLFKKEEIRHQNSTGMQGFAFNMRKALFKDHRVRRALAYAFDFGWTNKNLFHGQYARSESYYSNSELAASGLPSAAELKILEPYRGRIPAEVFTQTYRAPATDGTGRIRRNLKRAKKILAEAGWTIRDRKLVNAQGTHFAFQILLVSPAFERVVLPFARNLKRLGIEAKVRTVDPSQYQKRLDEYDFDMIVASFGQSLSPGNEQRNYWGSAAAGRPGSRNYMGINDPVIDALVEKLIAAPDRQSLIMRTRALDRVLLWNHFVIPHWHIRSFRVAYWDKFGRPKVTPKYGLGFDFWWVDPTKAGVLAQKKSKCLAK